jgi:hypothetical protein
VYQGSTGTLSLNTKNYDTLSEYNTSTKTFTATSAGTYAVHINVTPVSTNTSTQISILVNGSATTYASPIINAVGGTNSIVSDVVVLNASDTIAFGSNSNTFTYFSTYATITRIQ